MKMKLIMAGLMLMGTQIVSAQTLRQHLALPEKTEQDLETNEATQRVFLTLAIIENLKERNADFAQQKAQIEKMIEDTKNRLSDELKGQYAPVISSLQRQIGERLNERDAETKELVREIKQSLATTLESMQTGNRTQSMQTGNRTQSMQTGNRTHTRFAKYIPLKPVAGLTALDETADAALMTMNDPKDTDTIKTMAGLKRVQKKDGKLVITAGNRHDQQALLKIAEKNGEKFDLSNTK